jgi:putative tryptophan/tyrosine transport system substrate-binding protein
MRRREFIAGLAAAATCPLRARAQTIPVIGYLSFGTPTEAVDSVAAFLQGLAAAGYVEGRDVAIEFRWGNHQGRQLPSLAAELVQRQVAVIVALDGGPSALAAQAATTTIPILFLLGGDPAKFGFVAGGNMTGLTAVSSELMGKRVDLLREMAPSATTVGSSQIRERRISKKQRGPCSQRCVHLDGKRLSSKRAVGLTSMRPS